MNRTRINRMMKKWYGKAICRLIGEEKGAVAMEYIVIALLVAAAVVGLVMVFGGNLRNMLSTTNKVLGQTKPSGIEQVGSDYRSVQSAMVSENTTAESAGNKLGGDFSGVGGGGEGGEGGEGK